MTGILWHKMNGKAYNGQQILESHAFIFLLLQSCWTSKSSLTTCSLLSFTLGLYLSFSFELIASCGSFLPMVQALCFSFYLYVILMDFSSVEISTMSLLLLESDCGMKPSNDCLFHRCFSN